MEAMKIKNCGNYAMVRCVFGSNEKFSARFAVGAVYDVGTDADGAFVRADQGVLVYESTARFAEHVEEVQLCEPHADDDMEALQLSEPDYAPVEQDDVLSVRVDSVELPKPSPWDGQVGGTHYTDKAVQPLKLTLLNRGYEAFSGACYNKINKYTTRAKDNEVEQLKKARHVLDLWIYEAEQKQNG